MKSSQLTVLGNQLVVIDMAMNTSKLAQSLLESVATV